MAATTRTDSELFMPSVFVGEAFNSFLHDTNFMNTTQLFSHDYWDLNEMEKKFFLENDLESLLVESTQQANTTTSQMPRSASFSKVSEELNSLSLIPSNPSKEVSQILSNPNKRVSSSSVSSPKKQNIEGGTYYSSVNGEEDTKRMYYTNEEMGGLVSNLLANNEDYGAVNRMIQRSFSSHALGQLRMPASSNGCISALDSTMQGLGSISPALSQLFEVKENDLDVKPSSSGSNMRRVCSTGDIQKMNSDGQEEGGFKIGRYSLTERKERIHRYRQKRSERNFNKKIKYACRKTLADSRPRVRGRFARNEDVVDTSSSVLAVQSNKPKVDGEHEDEVDTFLEDEESLLIDRQSSGDLSECWGVPRE